MAYEICGICGRFFKKDGRKYCDPCYQKDQEEYAKVRDYILKHKGTNAMEISKAINIPLKTIYRFIDEERISIDSKANITKEGWHYGN